MEETKIREILQELNQKLSKKMNQKLKNIYDDFLMTCENIINLLRNKIEDISLHHSQIDFKQILREFENFNKKFLDFGLENNFLKKQESFEKINLNINFSELKSKIEERAVEQWKELESEKIKQEEKKKLDEKEESIQSKKNDQNKSKNQKGSFFDKFKNILSKKKDTDDVPEAHLEEETKAVFDEKLGKWIFEGEENVEEEVTLPPPKKNDISFLSQSIKSKSTIKENDIVGNLMKPRNNIRGRRNKNSVVSGVNQSFTKKENNFDLLKFKKVPFILEEETKIDLSQLIEFDLFNDLIKNHVIVKNRITEIENTKEQILNKETRKHDITVQEISQNQLRTFNIEENELFISLTKKHEELKTNFDRYRDEFEKLLNAFLKIEVSELKFNRIEILLQRENVYNLEESKMKRKNDYLEEDIFQDFSHNSIINFIDILPNLAQNEKLSPMNVNKAFYNLSRHNKNLDTNIEKIFFDEKLMIQIIKHFLEIINKLENTFLEKNDRNCKVIEELGNHVNDRERKILTLLDFIQKLKNQIYSTNKNLSINKEIILELKKIILSNNEKATETIDSLFQQLNDEIAENTSFKKQIKNLLMEKDTLINTINVLNIKIRNSDQKNQNLENSSSLLQNEYNILKENYLSLTNQYKELEQKNLQTNIAQKESQLIYSVLVNNHNQLKEDFLQLEKIHNVVEENCLTLQNKFIILEEKNLSLQNIYNELEINKMNNENNFKNQIINLEASLNKNEDEKSLMNTIMKNFQHENSSNSKIITEKEMEITNLKNQRSDLEKNMNENSNNFSLEKNKLVEEIQRMKAFIKSAEIQNKNNFEKFNNMVDKMKNEKTLLINKFTSKIQKIYKENETLFTLSDFPEKNVKNGLLKIKKLFDFYINQKNILKKEIEDLKIQLLNLSKSNSELRQEFETTREDLFKKNNELNNKLEDCKLLESKIIFFEKKESVFNESKNKLLTKNEELENENFLIRSEKEEIEQMVKSFTLEINMKNVQMNSIKKNYENLKLELTLKEKQIEENFSEKNSNFINEKINLENLIKEREKSLKDLQNDNSHLQNENNYIREKFQELEIKNQKLFENLSSEKNNHLSLQTQNNQLELKLEKNTLECNAKINILEKNILNYKKNISQLKSNISNTFLNLKQQLFSLKSSLNTVTLKILIDIANSKKGPGKIKELIFEMKLSRLNLQQIVKDQNLRMSQLNNGLNKSNANDDELITELTKKMTFLSMDLASAHERIKELENIQN